MRGGGLPMRTAVHITWHGAQINFGDPASYLTYAPQEWRVVSRIKAATYSAEGRCRKNLSKATPKIRYSTSRLMNAEILLCSVSDPYSFDTDLDPDPEF